MRGMLGGMAAGVVFGLLAALVGGAAGPGRMADVAPLAWPVLLHAITVMGVGGAVGGLLATWRRRRAHLASLAEPATSRAVTARLVVLVSGEGTTLQALLDACADPAYGARSSPSVPTATGAGGLARAERAGVRDVRVPGGRPPRPRRLGRRAGRRRRGAPSPTSWCSAGFMKLVGEAYLDRLGARTVNTHPALSPAFPGMHGPADALAYGVKVTGCTLFVVDGGVDTGPIVAQLAVPVEDDDTVDSLHERIKVAERTMLVRSVGRMAREGYHVVGPPGPVRPRRRPIH